MLIDILTALGVVVSIAFLMGILLALFVRFFGVEEDIKVKEIRAALPGIQCGACGFKGCNDYAEALAKGNAQPNLCIPGGEDTAKTLGEILGVNVSAAPKNEIAFVRCNGTCDVVAIRSAYDGITSCKAQAAFFGGIKSCAYGCLGCGDCAKVCPSHAIVMDNGVAKVQPDRCVGCGLCAKECPKKIISIIPQGAPVAVFCNNHNTGAEARKKCQNACIGCKKCEKVCPEHAVSVIDFCAIVDYAKCVGCGLCAEQCPTGSIHKTRFPDRPKHFITD